jgi:hypothetical protein
MDHAGDSIIAVVVILSLASCPSDKVRVRLPANDMSRRLD